MEIRTTIGNKDVEARGTPQELAAFVRSGGNACAGGRPKGSKTTKRHVGRPKGSKTGKYASLRTRMKDVQKIVKYLMKKKGLRYPKALVEANKIYDKRK